MVTHLSLEELGSTPSTNVDIKYHVIHIVTYCEGAANDKGNFETTPQYLLIDLIRHIGDIYVWHTTKHCAGNYARLKWIYQRNRRTGRA